MRVGIHEALPRYARQYGTVCKAFFGRSPIVIITDPDLVKQVWGPRATLCKDWHPCYVEIKAIICCPDWGSPTLVQRDLITF